MGTSTPQLENPENLNLSQLAADYESEQNLRKISRDIRRYAPLLASILDDKAAGTLSKSQLLDRVNEWKATIGSDLS